MPIRFEMSIDQTAFYSQLGGRLYNGLFEAKKDKEIVFDFNELKA
jgi:hypothetical protein